MLLEAGSDYAVFEHIPDEISLQYVSPGPPEVHTLKIFAEGLYPDGNGSYLDLHIPLGGNSGFQSCLSEEKDNTSARTTLLSGVVTMASNIKSSKYSLLPTS